MRRFGPLAVTWIVGTLGFGLALATGNEEPLADRPLPPEASGRGSERRATTSFLSQLIPPEREEVSGPRVPRSLGDLAKRLPIDRAVAQLFVFGFEGKDLGGPVFEELRRLDLGGVMLQGRNYSDPQQLAAMAGEFGVVARGAGHIPPWVFAEQDGGELSPFPELPPAAAPGEFDSVDEAAAAVGEAAVALRALGISGLLAPSLNVQPGESGGVLGAQPFPGEPAEVADYGAAVAKSCRDARMLCAGKHFPGLGAASLPTDEGPAQVGLSMEQLGARDLVPFRNAFRAGLPAVVIGHGLYELDDFVTPASISSRVIGGLLRRRMRFDGVAMTDDLADPGVSTFAPVPEAAVQAVQAGADLIYISGPLGEQVAAYTAVLDAVRRGEIGTDRVRRSLMRLVLAKRAVGLLGETP